MADDHDEEISLNGIRELDYAKWRHHPVTKIVLRYLLDYERQLAEIQIRLNRNITRSIELDPFIMGEFKGQINLAKEVRELSFSDIAAFYADSTEDEGQ